MRRFLPPLTSSGGCSSCYYWRPLLPLLATWLYAREEIVVGAQRLAEAQFAHGGSTDRGTHGRVSSTSTTSPSSNSRTGCDPVDVAELQRDALLSIAAHQPWTVIAFTVGADGMSLARSDNLAPSATRTGSISRPRFRGQPIGQQVVISRTTNKPGWGRAVPIKDPTARVVGVLAKTCGLNEVTDQLANVRSATPGRAMLIAPDGKLVAMTGAAFDKELRDFSKHPAFVGREARGGVCIIPTKCATIALRKLCASAGCRGPDRRGGSARPFANRQSDAGRVLVAVLWRAPLPGAAPRVARPLLRLTAVAEEISRGRFEHELTETERGDRSALSRARSNG